MRGRLGTAMAAVLTLGGVLVIAVTLRGEQPRESARAADVPVATPQSVRFAKAARPMRRSEPRTISIDRIGLKGAPVSPVGLNPDQTIEVPPLADPGLVGWYRYRPTPGERGGAVLVGHVDAYGEPAVFFKAHTLRRGDRVKIGRADGSTAVFAVDALERVDKNAFPTRRVYGPAKAAELRLITCGGEFDQATGHYEDNVIVYAHLVN